MQHKVEGGRGSARGEHRPVDHITVRAHIGARKGSREILHVFPVGRSRAPFQQSGAAEQPGAGLDAAAGARRLGDPAYPGNQRMRSLLARAKAADEDQHIGFFRCIELAADGNRQAARGHGGLTVDGDDLPVEHRFAGHAVGGAQRVDRGCHAHQRRAR
jgi:hypothetical protein